jgi:hypothetical protein
MNPYFKIKLLDDFIDSNWKQSTHMAAGLAAGLTWMLVIALTVSLVSLPQWSLELEKHIGRELFIATQCLIPITACIFAAWVTAYVNRKADGLTRDRIERQNIAYNNYLSQLSTKQLESGLRMAGHTATSFRLIELELLQRDRSTQGARSKGEKARIRRKRTQPD